MRKSIVVSKKLTGENFHNNLTTKRPENITNELENCWQNLKNYKVDDLIKNTMSCPRIIARLDIKGPNLVKGIHWKVYIRL